MAEDILINVTPQETRVARIENGVLQELVVERSRSRSLVGNVYLGRVIRVLPGMGAAFLEIGLQRTAFLHVSDINGAHDNPEQVELTIEKAVTEGQELLVQITKEPLGSKGARLTTGISIASRYLVLMPNLGNLGISQRIEEEEEKQRLRTIISDLAPALKATSARDGATADPGSPSPEAEPADDGPSGKTHGYIARTAAEGASRDALTRDMAFLNRLWDTLIPRIDAATAPAVIYEDLPLPLRVIRDLSANDSERIRIDSNDTFHKAIQFAEKFSSDLVPLIEHYPGERPIFDLYSTEDEIQRALHRRVELKSGGHLVIDQTEAMTTIDVNTGGFVGHRNLEETIFKTNLEATQAIARQLRLRNLGGIVIVDFIDMSDEEHQRQVLRALSKWLDRDNSRVNVSEVTSLGLVQITRKRTRESLEHVLCESCPTCDGRGLIKSAESVCFEIFREILREARQFEAQKLLVVASQTVVDVLIDDESQGVVELEEFIGIPIRFQVEPGYTQEQYDVVLV